MLARQNLLLRSLPSALFESLAPDFKLVVLKKGAELSASSHCRTAYFPITCVIAISARTDVVSDTYLCLASTDGCAGLSESWTAPGFHYMLKVCSTGYAIAISRQRFMQQVSSEHAALGIRLLSTNMVARLSLINASCAATHNATQRIARILVEARAAWPQEEPISLSHKELAEFVSVRRETVTAVIKEMEKRGLVKSHRGKLQIKHLKGLQQLACECSEASDKTKKIWMNEWRVLQSQREIQDMTLEASIAEKLSRAGARETLGQAASDAVGQVNAIKAIKAIKTGGGGVIRSPGCEMRVGGAGPQPIRWARRKA